MSTNKDGGQAGQGMREEAYPGLYDKAEALLHSMARNHALIDGNKRLALVHSNSEPRA